MQLDLYFFIFLPAWQECDIEALWNSTRFQRLAQTCQWEVLFKQLPHPFPPAFVTFFCPLMVHTTINYFLRFCQQNGMPLSNAAEPVDDDIVYSPDDEAVLVGWVLHSIIPLLLEGRKGPYFGDGCERREF